MALLVLVASLVLIRSAFAPVEMLSRQAEAIGPDNPGMRLTHPNLPSELTALVRAANEAAGRWETDVSRQRRFTADAAHQLLTPLAVLSARLDQDQHAVASPGMRGDVRRMSRMIAQLLDLSRLSTSAQTRERLDLTAVAREAVAAMAPLAIAEEKDLSFEAPSDPCEVFGVPASIGEALANVICNAIQHVPQGGCIAVRVIGPATITVEDDGPSIGVEHIGRLFEPFYTTRSNVGGTGLGLAIVAEILEQHAGEASAENRPEGGARFTLRFRPASRRRNSAVVVKAAA